MRIFAIISEIFLFFFLKKQTKIKSIKKSGKSEGKRKNVIKIHFDERDKNINGYLKKLFFLKLYFL